MRLMGLDEAGRGSVLGPMAIGAYVCGVGDEPALQAAGAADSKTLSARKRERVREALRPLGLGDVVLISAAQIDAGNLNQIEERVFIELIRRHRPDAVTIDAPVHPRGIPALLARLQAATPWVRFVVEPKADLNHPVVGAASIFAKVARDAALTQLSVQHGRLGSGYPSDPVTRAFIRGLLERGEPLPALVRSRWGTIDVLRQELASR